MKWWKRRSGEKAVNEQLANRIANLIIRLQTSFARFMNQQTLNRSSIALKRMLFLFLASGSVFSAYIIYSTLQKHRKVTFEVGHLSSPGVLNSDRFITKAEYQQLQKFEQYMDSLRSSGSEVYDSIQKYRPGLLDSIKLLESFYNSNKN